MFRDPVMVVESGHTYERSAILSHFERNGPKDPLTRLALSSTKVMTNWAVRQMVRDKHPDVTPRPHEAPHGFRHHMDYLAPYSTPLHVASKFGHDTVVKNLIEAGGEIGRHDDAGYTPLDWAAYFGHEGLIPMLLPEPMHLTHLFGYSIMEIASVMGHDIFVKTLFFYVAKSDLKYAAGILPKRFKVSIDAQHVLRFEESSEHRNQKQWSAAFIAKAAEGYTLARIALEDQHAKREYLGR